MASNVEGSFPDSSPRVEGWLNVWEVAHRNQRRPSLDSSVPTPIWEPCFCVLLKNKKRLAHFRSEKQADEAYRNKEHSDAGMRLDDGKEEFDKRWGYTALESIKENVMQHDYGPLASLEAFHHRSLTLDSQSISSQCSDSAYEKGNSGLGERRGSVPVVSGLNDDVTDSPSTPSRIASFFSKKVKSNLKRTKSVTKLDRRKGGYHNDLEGSESPKKSSSLRRSLSLGRLTRRSQKTPQRKTQDVPSGREEEFGALINHRIRASRSHESLLQINNPISMHSIDMSAQDIEIKPLHSSILGQEHCFQVSTSNGSKFYSCRSAEERQKWIQHLRKTVQPTQEQTRRTENSLKLSIQEAKNVPSKKRYFCELCLDNTLYARTSTKTKGDMLFWGEQFDFNNLPPVKMITINLYKEADKKKKKEKNQLIAYINIMVSEVSQRHLVERWYSASSAVVGKAGKDTKAEQPLLRIKARYQTVNILPMDLYQDLLQYLETDYCMLVEVLEPQISVKSKEEIATTIVHILQKQGLAKDFLADIVMAEVDKLENESLTFRGNSIATKAMEAFLKLVGDKHLQDTLGDFIRNVIDSGDDCEVDPIKVPNNAVLQRQQKNLKMYCEMAWFKIVNSHCFFPSDLRAVFCSFRECCEERKRNDLPDNLISSCIFLRFLCPAILSPSLFNLTQEFPNERAARSLTLVAKTIQCLANFTQFGAKEEFMTFMNEFVDHEQSNVKMFIEEISRPDPRDHPVEFDGYIDLGKELSILHSLLQESLEKVNDAANLKLSKLKDILEDIDESLRNPQALRRNPLNSSKGIYDNVHLVSTNHDQNANKPDGVVLTEVLYKDADLSTSVDNPQTVERSKAFPEALYSSKGRMRTGITEASVGYHSTEDYVHYTRLEDPPTVTAFSMSPSTYSSKRPEEKQVNRCWDKMVRAAEMVNGDRVDLITFADDGEDGQNSSMDSADQVSVSQLSTVASSGYQSIGYSQSSSPVELPHDQPQHYQGAHGTQQPLSFANPLFGHSNTLPGRGGETYQSPPSSLPRDHMFRSPSTSSLSSDDGATVTLQNASSYQQTQTASLPSANLNGLTGSSHSHAAVPGHGSHSFDRRLRNGSSSSVDSVQSTTSQDSRHRLHRHCATHRPYHSSQLSKSQPRVNSSTAPRDGKIPHSPVLTSNELSRSVELSSSIAQSPQGIKRTMTDSLIHQGTDHHATSVYTPPQSPHFGTLPPTWKTPAQAANKRLQKKDSSQKAKEKSTQEYEEELNMLRQQLAATQSMLADAQVRLSSEEASRHKLQTDMQQSVHTRETALDEQNTDKQGQIQGIMSRLHSVEETRRNEQDRLQVVVQHKQQLINEQNRRIQSLDGANTKLISALTQLKDRCQIQSRNGVASPMRQRIPLDDDEFKQSSC